MIQIFLEKSQRKRAKLILILQKEIESYVFPMGKIPCCKQKKNNHVTIKKKEE